tara:strand:+ start:16434 stop:17258 length:825 start_codon:yes stop_codon:yes gene_type:complete
MCGGGASGGSSDNVVQRLLKDDITRISRGEDGELFTRTDNMQGYRPDDVKIENLAPINTTGPEMIDRIPTNVDNLYYEGTNISKTNNQNNQNQMQGTGGSEPSPEKKGLLSRAVNTVVGAVPDIALAALTGGASIPAQLAVRGAVNVGRTKLDEDSPFALTEREAFVNTLVPFSGMSKQGQAIAQGLSAMGSGRFSRNSQPDNTMSGFGSNIRSSVQDFQSEVRDTFAGGTTNDARIGTLGQNTITGTTNQIDYSGFDVNERDRRRGFGQGYGL